VRRFHRLLPRPQSAAHRAGRDREHQDAGHAVGRQARRRGAGRTPIRRAPGVPRDGGGPDTSLLVKI